MTENEQLGFRQLNVNDQDSAFDMGKEPAFQAIPHSASTLTVEWTAAGAGWHHTCAGADQDESWAIDNLEVILDCASTAAVETVRAGSPPNPIAFGAGVTSGPCVGGTWDPVIDHTTFVTDSIADFAFVTGGPANVPLGPPGTLLCNPATPLLVFASAPAPGVPFALPVPDNCPLVGVEICAQGGSIDSGGASHLANALDVTIGSF